MIKEFKDISLKTYNTFGVDVMCERITEFDSKDDLSGLQDLFNDNHLILGGGSNILFTKNYEGEIIRPVIKGVSVLDENDQYISIRAGAGVIWDEFAGFCVKNDFGGIENLSYIPGNVGACPVQNIGAYGTEVKDVITEVEFYNTEEKRMEIISNKECEFGYRESIFKNKLKGKFIILSVTFRLTRKKHIYKLGYGNVKEETNRIGEVNLENIRQAVINIRRSKLPEPETTGNAGSFFRNPVVAESVYSDLKKEYKNIPGFTDSSGFVKIPAAWLIECAGWKGKKKGNVATHHLQPLIIINSTGKATGQEIVDFALRIVNDINNMFGIKLVSEVNIV